MPEAVFIIIYALACAACAAAALLELKRDLMMLQQNSYRTERYMRWLRASGDTTTVPRLMGMAVLAMLLVRFIPVTVAMPVAFLFGGVVALRLGSERYKKPLVWTARARRIFAVQTVLVAAAACAVIIPVALHQGLRAPGVLHVATAVLLGAFVASHILTVGAVTLLAPWERRVNRRYYDEAAAILRSMPQLKVVGVTGSYGKTSTKHFLQRILSEKYDTLMTPGSFNTTLGVVRTVREHLKPYNEVFVVEMGAKQPGDIAEICSLVHPSIGIVTAVGEQHLETFGTVEAVRDTKFELVDALPSDGLAVINDDFAPSAGRPVTGVECVRYALGEAAASPAVRFTAHDVAYGPHGTTFTVTDKATGQSLRLSTPLVGECNISNLVAAVIVALQLEVPREKIAYAVAHMEPVEHRLSVKRIPGGLTIIDDAYNSNPAGARMAMEVLAAMPGGRKIVVSPGMIELGDRQEELNAALGEQMGRAADVAIIVGRVNREALVSGLRRAGSPCTIITVDTFSEAQERLGREAQPGDVVIYENDLPDTFK